MANPAQIPKKVSATVWVWEKYVAWRRGLRGR